jgi:predicted ATPase
LDPITARERGAGAITRIEALGYRSLRYVSQTVAPFQVLVGANASGKSTFLDTVAFLGDLLRAGLEGAVRGDLRLGVPERAPDGRHLVWMRQGDRFEIAVEVAIPEHRRELLRNGTLATCRYEVAVDASGPLRLASEALWLKPPGEASPPLPRQPELFPAPPAAPDTLTIPPRKHAPQGWKKILGRGEEAERVTFKSETSGWSNPFRLGADKAALASLPDDEERFPVTTWFRSLLNRGIQRIVLSSEAMRRPSPPSRLAAFLPDGSNLPWVVHELEMDPHRLLDWLDHVREALPDVGSIATKEREDDRHRYLVLQYRNGLEAPSWLVSDGTLRLLALTLLAYAPDVNGIYLVEEPENGVHPRAVETVFQSLSSVYGAQVLCATHSPVVLSMAEAGDLLCFARDAEGATDIVRGSDHPGLKAWRGAVDLGTLFASGVLR